MAERAAITVIELWPHYTDCHRCGNETPHRWGWPYYEDFIIGEPAWWQTEPGGVAVCRCCYLELLAAEAQT